MKRISKEDALRIALREARIFVQKAEAWQERIEEDSLVLISGSKEGAACKRASMDLSRALSEMRK